jgi:hypothetical protein
MAVKQPRLRSGGGLSLTPTTLMGTTDAASSCHQDWTHRLKTARPYRPVGTVLAILFLSVAAAYSTQQTPVTPRWCSDELFQMTGHCFHEPDSLGRRFVSPSGDASLWYLPFLSPRTKVHSPQGVNQHYEARGSDWMVTSGYRGDRIFYRRAMLACNNTKWRQIEFEYPAWEKRRFDSFVTRTSFSLQAYKEAGC